ncbi:MAG: ATPase, T2SS/T4P/T4SS family [Planctomycetota bacterium]
MPDVTLAQSVFLINGITPLLLLALVLGWAWCASKIDKDAAYFHLPRIWVNLGLTVAAVLAIGLFLLIPFFIVGYLVAIVVMAGSLVGYAAFRNTQVAENQRWSLNLDSFREKMDEREKARTQKAATLRLMDRDGGLREVPGGDTPEAAAHQALATVIDFAVPRGAESIEMAVDAEKARMVAQIDGVSYPQESLEPRAGMELINYVKQNAGMDLEDRRRRQSGDILADTDDWGQHTLSVVTSGSSKALRMSLLIDAGERKQMGVKQLGMLPPQLETLSGIVEAESRVVLLASPAGQGLTTTLYAMLMEHDPYTQTIVTLEDEDVFEIEGVSHNRLSAGTTAEEYHSKLAAILRTDPAVVGTNRLPDARAAQLIASDGGDCRFYIGLPADDALKAIRTWVKAVGDPKRAARSLEAAVSQRLIRKLCDTCKTPYTPDPAAVKKLNLPADRVSTLYHASGQVVMKDKPVACPTCRGIGYRGRTAVYEVLPIDDEARRLIAAQDYDGLRLHLRKQKHWSLQEAGLAQVVAGVTDIKEVTRALGEKAATPKKRSAKPAATT